MKSEQKNNDSLIGIAFAVVLALVGFQLLNSNYQGQLQEKQRQIENLQLQINSFKDGVIYGGN